MMKFGAMYIIANKLFYLCCLVTEPKEDKVKLDSDEPQEPKVTHNFKIGSKVKHHYRYGEIKWIGKLAGLSDDEYAGIEMVRC